MLYGLVPIKAAPNFCAQPQSCQIFYSGFHLSIFPGFLFFLHSHNLVILSANFEVWTSLFGVNNQAVSLKNLDLSRNTYTAVCKSNDTANNRKTRAIWTHHVSSSFLGQFSTDLHDSGRVREAHSRAFKPYPPLWAIPWKLTFSILFTVVSVAAWKACKSFSFWLINMIPGYLGSWYQPTWPGHLIFRL
jgi:hypothetical protein